MIADPRRLPFPHAANDALHKANTGGTIQLDTRPEGGMP